MVAEEVNEAHANLQSAAARVVQADRSLRTGIIALNGSTEGLEQTSRFGDVLEPVTRPQEAVYALQLLMRAFTEYYTTVADYNRAQFRALPCTRLPGPGGRMSALPGEPCRWTRPGQSTCRASATGRPRQPAELRVGLVALSAPGCRKPGSRQRDLGRANLPDSCTESRFV